MDIIKIAKFVNTCIGNPRLSKKDKQLLINNTLFLPITADMRERSYYIINKIYSIISCRNCNNPALWKKRDKKQFSFCNNCLDSNVLLKSSVKTTQYSIEVNKLLLEHGNKGIYNLGNKNNYLGLLIKFETNFLPNNCSISERIWHINNNIYEQQICPICNKRLCCWNNRLNPQSYNKTCGKCGHKLPETTEQRKKTMINKYGYDSVSKVPIIKQSIKDTCNKRYGGQLHGSKKISNKIKKTNIKKYGVDNPAKAQIIIDKQIKTKIKKFGYKKSTITFDTWCNKIKNENNYDKIELKQIFNKLNNHDWLQEQVNNKLTITDIAKKYGFHHTMVMGMFNYYGIKYHKESRSYQEKQILEFCQSLTSGVQSNTRQIITPLELDIYMPNHNLAIEYDGLFWHSSYSIDTENKNYHLNKTKLCKEKGIQLLHIFENEWENPNKQKIWKSIIKNKLNKSSKIFARKCEIKEISFKDSQIFLNNNHLQGQCNSSINIGLYYNNELVSLMTFGKSRFNKKVDWELLRFCNKLNYSVVGAASRLFKNFLKGHTGSVISYADMRRSTGGLYRNLGFELSHESGPNYWYWKDGLLESRIQYQKHKLKNRLEKFDSGLTESENMYLNGYRKIFDCGNQVWVYK